MLHFESDYITGAHPQVMEALLCTNAAPLSGYGADEYSASAKETIASLCGGNVSVEFLIGGTQTNAIVIDTMLEDHEGIIAAETGHIALHEAGAIEHCGRKVITLAQQDGKIRENDLKAYLETFFNDENKEHMVFPGMVYLSHPTEYGTLYSQRELEGISALCRQYGLRLFVDGARLAYALGSEKSDLTLKDLATLTDVFYCGGTKAGALCGEAVVFCGNKRPNHFLNRIKKRGALLAKGRLLGVQFDTLFRDGLYVAIGKQANALAAQMEAAFVHHGFELYLKTETNQTFVILTDAQGEALKDKAGYSFWERLDENRFVARFATCWSTTGEDIRELERILKSMEQ